MKKIKESILYRRISQHVYVNILTKKYYYVNDTESTPLTQQNCEEELQNLIERKIFLKNIINDRDTWVDFKGKNDVHFFKDVLPVSYTQSKKIRNIILNLSTTPNDYVEDKHINRQEKRNEFTKINEQILELESIYNTLDTYDSKHNNKQKNNNIKQQINEVVQALDIQIENNSTDVETNDITTQDELLDNLVNNNNITIIQNKKSLKIKTTINKFFSKIVLFFKHKISYLKSKSQKQRLEKIISQKSNKKLNNHVYYSIFGRNKWQEFIQTNSLKDLINTNQNKETIEYYLTHFPYNYYINSRIVGAGVAKQKDGKFKIFQGQHFNKNKDLEKIITYIFGDELNTLQNEKLLKARSDIMNRYQDIFKNILNNQQIIAQNTIEMEQLGYNMIELSKKYKYNYYSYLSGETNDINIDNLTQLLYLKKQIIENEYSILECTKQNIFWINNILKTSITNTVYNEPTEQKTKMSANCKQYLKSLNTALVKEIDCINITNELSQVISLYTTALNKINSFLRYFTTINKKNYEIEKENIKQLLKHPIVKVLFLKFEDNKENSISSNTVNSVNIQVFQALNKKYEINSNLLRTYDDLINIIRSKYNDRILATTPVFEKSHEKKNRQEINKVLEQIINNEFKEVKIQFDENL